MVLVRIERSYSLCAERTSAHATYHRLDLFGVPIEWISELPGEHDDNIDGQEDANDHEQLVVFDDFLVQFDVGEYGMDAPCLREHCAEGQTESSHEKPSARGTN